MLNHFSHVRLFSAPWTVARQAPLSMGLSRQQYWSGLPCPPPGDLPNPGINSCLLHLLHWQILYHECHLGSPIYTGINYMYVFLYVETIILPSIFTLTVNKSGIPISISFSFYSSHNPPYWFQFEKQCIRLKKLLTAIKRAVFPSFNNFKIQTAISGNFFGGCVSWLVIELALSSERACSP